MRCNSCWIEGEKKLQKLIYDEVSLSFRLSIF